MKSILISEVKNGWIVRSDVDPLFYGNKNSGVMDVPTVYTDIKKLQEDLPNLLEVKQAPVEITQCT